MTAFFRIYEFKCLACFCIVCGLRCYAFSSCHHNTLWPLQVTFLQSYNPYLSCCLHFVLNVICSNSGIFKYCAEKKSKLSLPLKSSGIKTDYIFGMREDFHCVITKSFPKLECILFWRLLRCYYRGLRNKGLDYFLKYLSVKIVWNRT